MPTQPACFHRLDEILALLRGFDTRYLARQAGREAVERYARTDAPFRRRDDLKDLERDLGTIHGSLGVSRAEQR